MRQANTFLYNHISIFHGSFFMTGITVAAVQSDSIRGEIAYNIKHHIELAAIAADNGADVIVFPELSLIGYEIDIAHLHEHKPTDKILSGFQMLADTRVVHLLVGAPYRSETGLHIAAFYYSPNKPPQVYTKYFVHEDEKPYFVSGTMDVTIRVKGEIISPAICYDVSNPEHAEQAATKNTTIYAAGVMTTPNGYHSKEAHMKEYAKKYDMVTVLANYAGPTSEGPTAGRSAVWDETGKLLAVAPDSGEAIVFYVKNESGVSGKVLEIE